MTTRQLTMLALFIALVTVSTMIIQIPMPATQGFLNFGDAMIFVAAIYLGPIAGLIAGGLGSSLADLLSGFGHWAPWTLVIKGLEGFLVGFIAHSAFRQRGYMVRALGGMLLGAAWMVFGYYVAGGIMRGFPAAGLSVPGNVIQGLGSIVFAVPLLAALRHVRLK